jgi:uncharacterized membrane protein YfcA
MHQVMLIGLAVFAGAFVSGAAGFAFSAAAGAILLHVLAPKEGVPLMMACSIAVQAASLLWLRQVMRWRESVRYLIGGALGLVPALYFLTRIDPVKFRLAFGIFLAVYAGYMLLRPQSQLLQRIKSRVFDGLVGFTGGLIGGLTAMPGAAPVVWCDLRGLPKEQQRGVVQPYIAAMQVVAMVLLVGSGNLSRNVAVEFAMTLPALLAGTALGIFLFGKIDDATFRRFVLGALLVSGLSFVFS